MSLWCLKRGRALVLIPWVVPPKVTTARKTELTRQFIGADDNPFRCKQLQGALKCAPDTFHGVRGAERATRGSAISKRRAVSACADLSRTLRNTAVHSEACAPRPHSLRRRCAGCAVRFLLAQLSSLRSLNVF